MDNVSIFIGIFLYLVILGLLWVKYLKTSKYKYEVMPDGSLYYHYTQNGYSLDMGDMIYHI